MGFHVTDALRRAKRKIGSRKEAMLQHTRRHFFCFLPRDLGGANAFFFKLLFSGITINEDQLGLIENLEKEAVPVYVNKYRSYFEFFFYHTYYKKAGLPVPEIGLDYKVRFFQPLSRLFRVYFSAVDALLKSGRPPDPYESGYIEQELLGGRAAFMSLVHRKGFYRRFIREKTDPLEYLIDIQRQTDRPVVIIPQLMFFSRKPPRSIPTLVDILFGTEERPGKLRRFLLLFKNPGKVFVEISRPVNLKQFLETPGNREMDSEQLALILRRRLLLQMNRHRQSITGPVLKHPEELKESILTNDRLRSFMEHYSETRNIPIYKVYKEANEYLDEIAAKYSQALIRAASAGVRWVISLMFDGVSVNTEVLNKAKLMALKGPLVFVPCHKSHIDYLILSYILYHSNMPCPHIAAGKNLSFWPLGPIFRGGGAFFIRRTFRGAILYSRVFAEYIHKLLEEGFNIEFFIEGGRSRTGKLLQPKLGLLSILLNAMKNGACEDMVIAPIFIGYDRIPEEASYLHEIEGGQKRPESLSQVIRARKFLKKRYGRIYINFHEPVSVNEFAAQTGPPVHEMSSKELNQLCRNIGDWVINAINTVTIITPHAIVASAVLNCSRPTFSYDLFLSHVETYMNYVFYRKAKLADTLLMDHMSAVEYVFNLYIQRKFIDRISGENEGNVEDLFAVNENRRSVMEYYKNNCIAHFIPAAFTAFAVLEKDAFQISVSDLHNGYAFLQDFFQNEFGQNGMEDPGSLVQKITRAFVEDAILIPHPTLPDVYNLTSAGFRRLKHFAGFLITFFEAYWVVLTFFMRYPRKYIEGKDRMKRIQSVGNRMYKRKQIERHEATSKIYFQNAMDFFASKGIKGSENAEEIEFYTDKIQNCLRILTS